MKGAVLHLVVDAKEFERKLQQRWSRPPKNWSYRWT